MADDALSMALMGPMSKSPRGMGADTIGGMDGESGSDDAVVVAADVMAAIESKDAAALVDAMRNLMDVIHAKREESEDD